MEISRIKILAIDDNPDNLVSLKALIKESFPEAVVFTAISGTKGIKLAVEEDPDVILLDIVMPEMDGFEVCRRLKANDSLCNIPVVFVTALKGDKESRIKALECGGEAFLAKPIDESELTAQIRAMVKIKTANTDKRNENERLKRLVEERTSELEAELTERKLTQKALEESEEKYSILFKDSPDAYVILTDGIFTDCNRETEVMLRGDRTQIIGKSPDALSPEFQPDGRKSSTAATEKLDSALRNGKSTFEWLHRRLDGSDFYAEVTLAPFMLQGKPILFTTWRDITERKLAEESLAKTNKTLAERETLLHQILDTSSVAIFLVDNDGYIVHANQYMADIFGWPVNTLVGMEYIELIHHSERERGREKMLSLLSSQISSVDLERLYIRADQTEFWGRLTGKRFHDANGNDSGLIGIIANINERKLAEDSLRESNELNNSLLKTIPFGMDIVDEHGNILFQSDNFKNIFGDKAIGRKCWDLYRDDKKQCCDCPLHKGIEIGETETYESAGVLGGRTFEIIHTGMLFQGKKAMLEIFMDITERKGAEAELEELNNRFSELVASTDGIVWEADAKTFVFSFVSKNAERILGYKLEEWLQPEFWAKHIYYEDRDETVQFCTIQTNLCSDHDFEYRFVASDGRIVWLADFVKVIQKDGKPYKLHGLMVDLTERKKAELTLQESEDRYKSFISQVTEGVFRFECDEPMDVNLPLEEQVDFIYDHFFIAECNDAFRKIYGIDSSNEMIGKSHSDFLGGRGHQVNREVMRTFVKNGYFNENTVTEEMGSDKQQLFILNNSLGIIKNNRLVSIWGTQTDVTVKIKADLLQQVLYAISRAALSSIDLSELIEVIRAEIGKLLDATNFYIAFYDETTQVLSTHQGKDEMDLIYSWPAEKSLTGLVVRSGESVLLKNHEMQKLYESGEVEQIGTSSQVWLGVPLRVNAKAIGAIVVQSYYNPDAYNEKDKLMLEFISNQVSISIERKKADQDLKEALAKAQESDRLKSAFLANMSHEIRTPLNSIVGFSDLLLDPDYDREQHAEFAKIISSSGNGLLAIISDIMDFSKIEAGQVVLEKVKFSANRLVAGIQKEYSLLALQKGLDLKLSESNPKDEIFIFSDLNRIRQVLINFVGNAIKFTERGVVEIGLKKSGNQLLFSVRDTGIGISTGHYDQVFERFRQVESSNTRKYGGNGLGLAISKSLVEMLGGEIGMESEKGKGSTFYFTIPL